MARTRPRSRFRLFLEQLEDRTVPSGLMPLPDGGTSGPSLGGGSDGSGGGVITPPNSTQAIFGTPWLDGTRLSLSFAADGTSVDNQASALFSTLGALPTSVWQTEILRAFQTWAANANINIGVVNDGGQDFGVAGAVQGDSRFGDIRVGARVFDTHIAMNSPFNVLSNTRAGDLLLNSADTFSIGGTDPNSYDLYSSVLQEVGNILGIGDNLDHPDSAMYHYYNGLHTGLSSYDIGNIQALYGARRADAYEGFYGNGSIFSATAIGAGSFAADITTLNDVDYYRFTVPFGVSTFSVRVKANEVSLLTPHLTVLNGMQQVVASASSIDPLNNTVVVQINNVMPFSQYYIKVQGSRQDVFGIGAYRLRVFAGAAADMPAGVANNDFSQGSILDDAHTNDTLAAATLLGGSNFQSDTRFDLRVQGVLHDAADVDFYRFVAPTVAAPTNMVVMAWSAGQSPLYSKIQVYDQFGTQVKADVVVNDQGNYVVQVNNIISAGTYYVRVAAADGSANNVGNYVLGVDFGNGTPVLQSAGAGTLSDTVVQSYRILNVLEGQVMHFVLNSSADAFVDSAVLMKIYDSDNNVVFTLLSKNGEAVSGNIYLDAGTYTVRIEGGTRTGVALPPIFYDVRSIRVTDPIDPVPLDPTLTPVGVTVPTFSWTQVDPTAYSILDVLDPYSNPWMGI